jgi:hypothetical protein
MISRFNYRHLFILLLLLAQLLPMLHAQRTCTVPCIHRMHPYDVVPCTHACQGPFGVFPCHPNGDIVPCVHWVHPYGDIVYC